MDTDRTTVVVVRADEPRVPDMNALFKALYGAANPKQDEKPRMKLQPIRKEKLPGRNDPCPCGSGKKAKKCCLDKIKALAALPPRVREQVVVANILGHWPGAEVAAPPASDSVTTEGVTTEDVMNAAAERIREQTDAKVLEAIGPIPDGPTTTPVSNP
jgi:hypothetical protein